ncbi:hypothetical protein F4604DRAFT_1684459 [Suillus subluteus]|nr:hypothetical protein F4604DRAFT_1684459 [Suillus subluteus]
MTRHRVYAADVVGSFCLQIFKLGEANIAGMYLVRVPSKSGGLAASWYIICLQLEAPEHDSIVQDSVPLVQTPPAEWGLLLLTPLSDDPEAIPSYYKHPPLKMQHSQIAREEAGGLGWGSKKLVSKYDGYQLRWTWELIHEWEWGRENISQLTQGLLLADRSAEKSRTGSNGCGKKDIGLNLISPASGAGIIGDMGEVRDIGVGVIEVKVEDVPVGVDAGDVGLESGAGGVVGAWYCWGDECEETRDNSKATGDDSTEIGAGDMLFSVACVEGCGTCAGVPAELATSAFADNGLGAVGAWHGEGNDKGEMDTGECVKTTHDEVQVRMGINELRMVSIE